MRCAAQNELAEQMSPDAAEEEEESIVVDDTPTKYVGEKAMNDVFHEFRDVKTSSCERLVRPKTNVSQRWRAYTS